MCVSVCISKCVCVCVFHINEFVFDVHLFLTIGVCLGMQVAVIEFARNVLGWKGKVNNNVPTGMVLYVHQMLIPRSLIHPPPILW